MFYLVLIIIASLVIVTIVIRRLPTMHLGRIRMDATNPVARMRPPAWRHYLSWLTQFFHNFSMPAMPKRRHRRDSSLIGLDANPLPVPAAGGSQVSLPRHATIPAERQFAHSARPNRSPEDFWDDSELDHLDKFDRLGDEADETTSKSESRPVAPTKQAGLTEMPVKGFVTRRGEAQKIAQELMARAEEHFNKKQFNQAETFYLQAAAKDPDNARAYNRLGVIYLHTKNYKDAVEAFRGAIKIDDQVSSRHFNLALAYLGRRDYRSAEKALREAVKLEPTNDKYRQTLKRLQEEAA